jgi:xyloglucan galactosyltransferase MUR3
VRAGNVSIEEELRKIPPAAVEKMREEVIKLMPRLIYADPRYNKLQTVKDAFDVSMDGVLERVKTQINGGGDYGATAGWD